VTVAAWGYGCTKLTPNCNPDNTQAAPANFQSRSTLALHPLKSVTLAFTRKRDEAFSAGVSYCLFTSIDGPDAREKLDPARDLKPNAAVGNKLGWLSFDIVSWPGAGSDTHACRSTIMSTPVDWP
jgi:hypothetical protein